MLIQTVRFNLHPMGVILGTNSRCCLGLQIWSSRWRRWVSRRRWFVLVFWKLSYALAIFFLGCNTRMVWWFLKLDDLYTPQKLTWNLKIDPSKRRFLLGAIIFRFHVSFWGSMLTFFFVVLHTAGGVFQLHDVDGKVHPEWQWFCWGGMQLPKGNVWRSWKPIHGNYTIYHLLQSGWSKIKKLHILGYTWIHPSHCTVGETFVCIVKSEFEES